MAETTAMKHRLIDLRVEVNAERNEAFKAAKSVYENAKKEVTVSYKQNIVAIKAEYKHLYNERKAVIVSENEEA